MLLRLTNGVVLFDFNSGLFGPAVSVPSTFGPLVVVLHRTTGTMRIGAVLRIAIAVILAASVFTVLWSPFVQDQEPELVSAPNTDARVSSETASDPQPATVRTTPPAATGALAGRIATGAGAGLPGFEIELHDAQDVRVSIAVSGEDGAFAFPQVQAGDYVLTGRRRGAAVPLSQQVRVVAGQATTCDCRIEVLRDYTLHTATRRTPTEVNPMPLGGVTLSVHSAADDEPTEHATVTAADGTARFRAVPAGNWILRAVAAGHCPVELSFAAEPFSMRDLGNASKSVVVILNASSRQLRGRVLDPDGRPVAEALVVLTSGSETQVDHSRQRRSAQASSDAIAVRAVSSASGDFELAIPDGPIAGALLVCAGRPGLPLLHRRALSTTELQGQNPLDVALPRASRVTLHAPVPHGSDGAGRMEVTDGTVVMDLAREASTRSIAGLSHWNRIERLPNGLVLDLAPGGYKVSFATGTAGAPQLFFATVRAAPEQTIELRRP